MGSDDGVKARRSREWYGALVCVCIVGSLLFAEQRLARRRVVQKGLRGRVGVLPPPSQRLLDATGKPANATTALAVPDNKATEPEMLLLVSLRDLLVAKAREPPGDVIAWLDTDPLLVEDVDVTAWTCPSTRLLSKTVNTPSAAAARNLREGEPGAAFLWFEHLSKAGGTSFCAFVRKNIGFKRTPPYYCMPSDGAPIKGTDGRVGTWPAVQLNEYVDRTKHGVVANEWDGFPGEMLRDLTDRAVLTTVIRDPIDRLVSAHKFWGVLHNPSPKKPDLLPWLAREDKSARRFPIRAHRNNFASQVGRNNFATWKFSSGENPRFDDCQDPDCHAASFALALANLERFHIAAPTSWQSHAAPFWQNLGFHKLEEVHIVPSGKVQDSKSAKEMDSVHMSDLRHKNYLDYLLWAWVRRAFLERLHCPPPDEQNN